MHLIIKVALLLCAISMALSAPSGPGYKKEPEGYFQYINVPGHKEYEFGFNRGNPHHFISRFEQAKDHRFRTRVKWADTKDGYGEHYWEYNHGPQQGYKDEHKVQDGYGPPVVHKGYGTENVEIVVPRENAQEYYAN